MTNQMMTDEALLARLVAFDTTSALSNLPFADFVCDYLDKPGVSVTRVESPDRNKTNLLISCGPAREDRSGILLSGHMDVVPANEDGWSGDPFQLRENGDRLFARGACDMKGFLALAMNRFLSRTTDALKSPLYLLYTYDEEVGTVGAAHFRKQWNNSGMLPAFGVIGEPTKLQPVRMHKGHLKLSVHVSGRSAHSGYPELGVNAIEIMGHVITALEQFDHRLRKTPYESASFYPEAPYCSMNQAIIAGGAAVNVVPDYCLLELGIRLLPGVNADDLIAEVRAALADLPQADRIRVETRGVSPALETSACCRHHRYLVNELELSPPGGEADDYTAAVAFASDAGVFSQMGMDCILFGPGDISVAHRPDEYVPRQDLAAASRVLDRLIHEFCEKE